MRSLILKDQFSLQASQERVWDLLGLAVLRCLPLEKIQVANENSFSAVLRMPLILFNLTFNIKGVLELNPPESLVCLLQGQSKWKILKTNLSVGFTLKADDTNKTLIKFYAAREGKGQRNIIEWLLSPKEKSYTVAILNSVRKTLEELA